ncbi:hypothetical protein ACJJTC_002653 [Scirpophaga incertulas]
MTSRDPHPSLSRNKGRTAPPTSCKELGKYIKDEKKMDLAANSRCLGAQRGADVKAKRTLELHETLFPYALLHAYTLDMTPPLSGKGNRRNHITPANPNGLQLRNGNGVKFTEQRTTVRGYDAIKLPIHRSVK